MAISEMAKKSVIHITGKNFHSNGKTFILKEVVLTFEEDFRILKIDLLMLKRSGMILGQPLGPLDFLTDQIVVDEKYIAKEQTRTVKLVLVDQKIQVLP
jgi:hypothetical protein